MHSAETIPIVIIILKKERKKNTLTWICDYTSLSYYRLLFGCFHLYFFSLYLYCKKEMCHFFNVYSLFFPQENLILCRKVYKRQNYQHNHFRPVSTVKEMISLIQASAGYSCSEYFVSSILLRDDIQRYL